MPVGDGSEEVELVYVLSRRSHSGPAQADFLDEQGLKPDPQAQMADNEQDPAFADEHPNGFQWDLDGLEASFVAYFRDLGGRVVYVIRGGHGWGWGVGWWFAGVRNK